MKTYQIIFSTFIIVMSLIILVLCLMKKHQRSGLNAVFGIANTDSGKTASNVSPKTRIINWVVCGLSIIMAAMVVMMSVISARNWL